MCEYMNGYDFIREKSRRTPPDLGIFTTVSCWPNNRCISTFSFSCPTTTITLTRQIYQYMYPQHRRAHQKNELLKASTQALTRANLRSFDCAEPAAVAIVAKEDGVSTIIPDA